MTIWFTVNTNNHSIEYHVNYTRDQRLICLLGISARFLLGLLEGIRCGWEVAY